MSDFIPIGTKLNDPSASHTSPNSSLSRDPKTQKRNGGRGVAGHAIDNQRKPLGIVDKLRQFKVFSNENGTSKASKLASRIKMWFLQFESLRESRLVSVSTRVEYQNLQEQYLAKLRDDSLKSYESNESYQVPELQLAKATKPLDLGSELFLPSVHSSKREDHQAFAKKAAMDYGHKNVPNRVLADIGTMKAYGYRSSQEVEELAQEEEGLANPILREGCVTPTSYILGKPEEADHLHNIYVVQIEGESRAVIRTGVIDTQKKAEEFEALLRQIRTAIPNENSQGPLKIVSHQLNSINEKRMIENQHYWMAVINKNLKRDEVAEVIHINTPSNRWYYYEKLFRVDRFLGEGFSKTQNLDSWGTMLMWLQKSVRTELNKDLLDSLGELDDHSDKILAVGQAKAQVDECRKKFFRNLLGRESNYAELRKAQAELRKAESDLSKAREGSKKKFQNIYDLLKRAENAITQLKSKSQKDSTTLEEDLRKISLTRMVLGSQLDISGAEMDRGKEGMVLMMLNEELGITGGVNCKSGLDRTGIWSAVKLGMEVVRKKLGKEHEYTMVRDWDTTTEILNCLVAKYGQSSVDDWILDKGYIGLEGMTSVKYTTNDEITIFVKSRISKSKKEVSDDEVSDDELNAFKDKLKVVMEFRKQVLGHLIGTGIPIIQRSTGLVGFKWNKGMVENLIPLNFLPSEVIECLNQRTVVTISVPLVKYDKRTGKPVKLTDNGRRLLTKFSSDRGS